MLFMWISFIAEKKSVVVSQKRKTKMKTSRK